MILMIGLLTACRPDLGTPNYPDVPTWGGDSGSSGFLVGPDPYVEGEDRLSLGAFYEGEASEFDPADHLYIYEATFSIRSSNERVEGQVSDVWEHSGGAWWGGGIHWDSARDLSGWATLNIDLMAPAEGGIASVDLTMLGGSEGRAATADYGFVADGEWHHLVIDLADFAAGGTDLTQVLSPLSVVGEGGADGDELFIDNLYLE